jgi:hypothetical protein
VLDDVGEGVASGLWGEGGLGRSGTVRSELNSLWLDGADGCGLDVHGAPGGISLAANEQRLSRRYTRQYRVSVVRC